MWGVLPAAGVGSRFGPLAFSKELLPVGPHIQDGGKRPRAVVDHLIERMRHAGATRFAVIIAPGKTDIVRHFGAGAGPSNLCFLVQPRSLGLCDAIFRAAPFVRPDEDVLVGLPDTVWFPLDGYARLPEGDLSMLTFPVDRPEQFDAVVTDVDGLVREVQVKCRGAASHWVWGALRMSGAVLSDLHVLWRARRPRDEYVGTLINAYIGAGGTVRAIAAGRRYVDVGTMDGYRRAVRLLEGA